jgi:hypothetical protein
MAGSATDSVLMQRSWIRPLLLGTFGMGGLLSFWTLMAFWLQGGGGVISRLPTPTAVAHELFEYAGGLGAHLIAVQQSYDVAAVMAAMICFGLAGFIMNAAFTALEIRLPPWRAQ